MELILLTGLEEASSASSILSTGRLVLMSSPCGGLEIGHSTREPSWTPQDVVRGWCGGERVQTFRQLLLIASLDPMAPYVSAARLTGLLFTPLLIVHDPEVSFSTANFIPRSSRLATTTRQHPSTSLSPSIELSAGVRRSLRPLLGVIPTTAHLHAEGEPRFELCLNLFSPVMT